MKNADKKYLIYAQKNTDDDFFGLDVMEKNSVMHAHELFLIYDFHDNNFFFVKEKTKNYFIPPSQVTHCIDEFGNEYRGQELKNRINAAISAYENELPGFIEFCNDNPILTEEDE